MIATLRFEPDLIEAVTHTELQDARRRGNAALVAQYHALADPLYDSVPPGEREAEFARFHARWFFERGWGAVFTNLWREFPEPSPRASNLLVLVARHKRDEGAVIGRDGVSVCLRVLPARFSDAAQLVTFLRHELLHAADMLEPTFGYQLVLEASLSQANHLADIYHAVWCAHVDARLVRRGHVPLLDADSHRTAFDRLFAELPPAARAARWSEIWNAPLLTHAAIVEIARAARAAGARRTAPPGGLCPLCRFPTFRWAKVIALPLADAIRSDFPTWQDNDGACERCVERYEMVTTAG